MIELLPWGVDKIDDLVDLMLRAAEDEDLTADEILTACHERSGIVMATEDGDSVIAVGIDRDLNGELLASVRLIAVGPKVQRSGRGGLLLDHAEQWAAERGAGQLVVGGALPFSLWPGTPVDSAVALLCTSRGYDTHEFWQSYEVATSFRSSVPEGIEIRRAIHDDDVTSVLLAATSGWPRSADEIARALEHGTCHVALRGDTDPVVVGIGCHSVTRAGWTGPILVDESHRRRGIGQALLAQICRDLMIAEFDRVVIADIPDDGARSFAESVGAVASIRYQRMSKALS
ncbi:MAG: GNAT family N-acetyltransferase [Acidimicrobiales bacterium]